MPRFILRVSIPMVIIGALVVLLALGFSRVLPGAGAIAFFWYRDGVPDIYALDLGRGTFQNLTRSGSITGIFAISPDGQQLAFEVVRDNGRVQLQVMDTYCQSLIAGCNGSPQSLADSPADTRNPVWSPDGRQIAFFYDVTYDQTSGEIVVMNLADRTRFRLPYPSTLMYPFSWSPDSQRLFVGTYDGSHHEVYSVSIDGSGAHTVTTLALGAGVPIWSPDGSRFAYLQNPSGGVGELRFTYADGRDANISVSNVDANVSPSWSPDSRQIAFVMVRQDGDYLYTMDADGSNIRSVAAGDLLYSSLSWSPDSHWIAFNRLQDGREDIFLLDIPAGDIRRLTNSGAIGFPTWMPG
jgi:Tol biopolymer transport system component